MKRYWSTPKPTNTWSALIANIVESYISKEVPFRFRGIDFNFALSQGLFSSNDIDTGTRLLLRVLSQTWDGDMADLPAQLPPEGSPLPRSILDAGCGVGVIGICAARALMELYAKFPAKPPAVCAGVSAEHPPPFFVRAQDRDELARLFTQYNAEKNSPPSIPFAPIPLEAHTEPLLAFPADRRWDLILTNIPAKAGESVLEDFVRRSMAALNPGGRVIMVAVNPLINFFRTLINQNGVLVREEAGREHTVFVYRREEQALPPQAGDREHTGPAAGGPVIAGEHFVRDNPFYLRSSGDYEMEGTGYHINAVHGAAEFDRPAFAAAAAAKLVSRLGLEKIYPPLNDTQAGVGGAILIHESGQGHFPAWLLRYGARGMDGGAEKGPDFFQPKRLVLTGRNILALEAARHNTRAALAATVPDAAAAALSIQAIPQTELPTEPGVYGLIVAFPEWVPRTDRTDAFWEGLDRLLLPGGTALIALPSWEAEKFDRKKTASGPNGPHFTRLGDIKRQGFRALAYRKNQDAKN
ncbi:hypothetical protein AGMMS50268_18830 [Spirochaetia bacterium]|nr:hypothetical protein AGMMS50268_18830 [Spirochaetia bacterium]